MGMAANWREYTWMPSKSKNKHGLLPGRGSKGRNEEGQFSTVRFAWTRDLKPKVKKNNQTAHFRRKNTEVAFNSTFSLADEKRTPKSPKSAVKLLAVRSDSVNSKPLDFPIPTYTGVLYTTFPAVTSPLDIADNMTIFYFFT